MGNGHKEKIEQVRKKIRRARFSEALDDLDVIIEELGDKELDKMFTLLSARFNSDFKDYISGVKVNDNETVKIILSLTELLREVEKSANELSISQNKDTQNNNLDEDYTQIEKIAYIKLIHIKERKEGNTPVYMRYIPRLEREVEVFDEAQFFRIIKYSKPLTEINVRDRSSGIIDINILHPWQELEFTDYGSAQIEHLVTQVIDMSNSNVFCSTMYFINGFQKGNTDYMTQMEMKTKTGRLIVDFSSLPNHKYFLTGIPKGFKRVKGFDGDRPVTVEELRPGMFHIESINLSKGDVIGLKFEIDWTKI